MLPQPPTEVADAMKLTEDELLAKLQPIKKKLFEVAAKRERPFLDTKVLTGLERPDDRRLRRRRPVPSKNRRMQRPASKAATFS